VTALWIIVIVAVTLFLLRGLNVTLTVPDVPAATVNEEGLTVTRALFDVTLDTVKAPVPALVMVIFFVDVAPIFTAPKATVSGLSL
jgi:hypothetical protein